MVWTNVGRAHVDGVERFVVESYADKDSVVAGLDWSARRAVLQGVQDVFDQQMGPGVTGGPRMRPMLHFIALEILFEVAKRKEFLWGRDRLRLGFAASRGARGNLATQRSRDKHERPALLDLVDWDLVDPWMLDMDVTRELRRIHGKLEEELFDPGPFFSASELTLSALRRLHDAHKLSWSEVEEQEWAEAIRNLRAVRIPGTDIRFRGHGLGPVLEFYGVGQRTRRFRRFGFCISPWKIEHVLRGMRWTGGLDVRDIPWMQDRYLHRERHAHLIEGRDLGVLPS